MLLCAPQANIPSAYHQSSRLRPGESSLGRPAAAHNSGASSRLVGDGAGEDDGLACRDAQVTDVPRTDAPAGMWAADVPMHLRLRGRESLTPFGRPRERDGPVLLLATAGVMCGEGDRSSSFDSREATLPGGGLGATLAAETFRSSSRYCRSSASDQI